MTLSHCSCGAADDQRHEKRQHHGTCDLLLEVAMAVDAEDNAYFVALNCVFKLDQHGIVTRTAGNRLSGYSGDGGLATYKPRTRAQDLNVHIVTWDSIADTLKRTAAYEHVGSYLRWRLDLIG
jgi:hypothetical protein